MSGAKACLARVHAARGAAALASVLAAAGASAQGGITPEIRARGAIAYVTFCSDCHGGNGEGSAASGAPSLAGRSAADLIRQLSRLKQTTASGGGSSHASVLAGLNADEIRSIAAYLEALAPPPPVVD